MTKSEALELTYENKDTFFETLMFLISKASASGELYCHVLLPLYYYPDKIKWSALNKLYNLGYVILISRRLYNEPLIEMNSMWCDIKNINMIQINWAEKIN